MFRTFITAAALFLVSFAAQASEQFDEKLFRSLCVKADLDASKLPKCMADAKKQFNSQGELGSAISTCKFGTSAERKLDCLTHVAENATGVDLPRVRGICNQLGRPKDKVDCYGNHLRLNDQENKKEREEYRIQNFGIPAPHGGGSVR